MFSPAALASLEGKDITRGHPAEMLAAENQASYSKGHLEHVRRDGDNTVADLIIKDPGLASDVESGVLREVSCGYYCRFEPYLDGYRQTNLVGNHVAVVPRGRPQCCNKRPRRRKGGERTETNEKRDQRGALPVLRPGGK